MEHPMTEDREPLVFDASALLAFLYGEAGADEMERLLPRGGVCGATNWSEVAQKVAAAGADWPVARATLASYGVTVEPVTETDAELAASLWQRGFGLSIADRLCLALARRSDAIAITADTAWSDHEGVYVIR
jgi:PIN domain nuclease of toxin-antitoxin system